jgi:hypothetical protein
MDSATPPSSPAAETPPAPVVAPLHVGPPGPPALLLLVLAAGFLPALILFGISVWSQPAYRFFPLGAVAVVLLCWLGGRREPSPRGSGPAWLTGGFLGLAVLLLAGAIVLWSPWLGAVAAAVALPGVANWVGGPPLVRAWLPGWLVALILVPPPLGLTERLLDFLRGGVVALSRPLLGQFDVLHVVRSDSIEVSGRVVPLAGACAGLYLIPAGMVLALVLMGLLRRGWFHSLVVALAMPLWTLLATVAWFTLGLKQAAGGGLNFFGGLGALAAGGTVLLVLGGLALSMDQLLKFLTESRRAALVQSLAVPAPRPPRRAVAASGLGWGVALGCAVLGLGQAGLAARGLFHEPPMAVIQSMDLAPVVNLPPELLGWRQITNRFSALDDLVTPTANAPTWHFVRGELAASVTLEQPLAGYEGLSEAYRKAGWRTLAVADQRAGTNAAAPFVAVAMQKDMFQFGRVWQAVGALAGGWLTPPRPEEGRTGLFGFREPVPAPRAFRLQLFVSSLEPLTVEELESAESLFQTVRQQLAVQLTGQPGS